MDKPTLLVFAGPNGSGKSTIVSKYSEKFPSAMAHYVNADEIQRYLSCDPLTAAQIAESTRKELLKNNHDFAFETVLSTDRNYLLMKEAQEKGYYVICIYVLTANPKINVERVKARMKSGGNAVEIEKITPRYLRAMKIFPKLIPVCNELYAFDNSQERTAGTPKCILSSVGGKTTLHPSDVWTEEMLIELINGNYAGQTN